MLSTPPALTFAPSNGTVKFFAMRKRKLQECRGFSSSYEIPFLISILCTKKIFIQPVLSERCTFRVTPRLISGSTSCVPTNDIEVQNEPNGTISVRRRLSLKGEISNTYSLKLEVFDDNKKNRNEFISK